MLVKLKWLKHVWQRDIVPAAGAALGKVLYTTKNATGRRTQYVLDLDNKTAVRQNINASPADLKTEPGAVVEYTSVAPITDASLYAFGLQQLPVIVGTQHATFDQTIANGAAITAINVLSGVTINGVAATTVTATINMLEEDGLTLNETTGAVTLDDNLTAGIYTVNYTVEDKTEPSVIYTGVITVEVEEEV